MRTQIKATNIELSEAIKGYIEKRLGSLGKYFGGEDDPLFSVEVGKTTKHHKSGNIFRAEVKVSSASVKCYAVSEKEDLYAAIDEVKDEVSKEIISSKKKGQSLFRRGGAKIKSLIKKLTN